MPYTKAKVKVKIRSNKVTKSKYRLSVVRRYGSFKMQNSMVAFIFKFGPRNGQFQVKLGQIRSNFKIQDFPSKTCLSCKVLSQDSKTVIYFYVRQLEMPKIALQKCDVITSTRFFGHCTAKNKDIALKLCMWVV